MGVLDAPGAGGSDGVAAGPVAGFGAGEVNTTEPPRCWVEKIARASDVTIKMHAAAAVNLPRKLPGPRGPKTVWLAPPKAAPSSAPFPACKSTMRMRATATMT